jgi:quinolinate synthase
MRLNTLEKLYDCLRTGKPEIEMSPELIAASAKPLEKMMVVTAS